MRFGAATRKLALAVHLGVSVAWIGAVLAYLALDLASARSGDPGTLRAAYVAMDIIVARVIVPLAYATLATGIALALGTRWGLFRHYWVVLSLALTALATLVLVVETDVVASLAEDARDPATSDEALRALPSTLPHSIGGALLLVVVLALNVWKPRGVTPYGWRKEQQERANGGAEHADGPR